MVVLGTRGDLELFAALGRALARRGHHVCLGTSPFYAGAVRAAGLEWAQVGQGSHERMIKILRAFDRFADKTARARLYYHGWVEPELAAGGDQIAALARGADYFISNLKLVLRKGAAVMPAASVTYDPPAAPADLTAYAGWEHGDAILELVAFRRALIDPDGTWDPRYRFTGFWTSDAADVLQPPGALCAWVDQGEPPVVVTLGSMVSYDVNRLVALLGALRRQTGRRVLLVLGWSGAPAVAACEGVAIVREASYDWLFPRACAVVHHGSYGASTAAILAGRCAVVLPQLGCQELMGRALARVGLAAGVFDLDGLSADTLGDAVELASTDPVLRATAAHWQRAAADEPGVHGAAEWVEEHALRLAGALPAATCVEKGAS